MTGEPAVPNAEPAVPNAGAVIGPSPRADLGPSAGARVPVAVILGGPSAEHEVSIVSGTAIAEALADAGHPVREHLIDLDGRWWALPEGHHRSGRPQSAYDDPVALGASGPLLAGEAPRPSASPGSWAARRCADRPIGCSRHWAKNRALWVSLAAMPPSGCWTCS